MKNSRNRFKEILGRTYFPVRHQVAGKEAVETEILSSATEHATAYPCVIEIDPGELGNKLMSVFDSWDSEPWKETHEPVTLPRPRCETITGEEKAEFGEKYPHPSELPPPPDADDDSTFVNPPKLVSSEFLVNPDHFVVTIICPCGSSGAVSSRSMTAADLEFVSGWVGAHQHHAVGAKP